MGCSSCAPGGCGRTAPHPKVRTLRSRRAGVLVTWGSRDLGFPGGPRAVRHLREWAPFRPRQVFIAPDMLVEHSDPARKPHATTSCGAPGTHSPYPVDKGPEGIETTRLCGVRPAPRPMGDSSILGMVNSPFFPVWRRSPRSPPAPPTLCAPGLVRNHAGVARAIPKAGTEP